MKITHLDGSVTDTSRLNDFSAQLFEKNQEYIEFLCNNKVPFLIFFRDPVSKHRSGGQNFNQDIGDFRSIISSMDTWLEENKTGLRIVNWEKVKHVFEE